MELRSLDVSFSKQLSEQALVEFAALSVYSFLSSSSFPSFLYSSSLFLFSCFRFCFLSSLLFASLLFTVSAFLLFFLSFSYSSPPLLTFLILLLLLSLLGIAHLRALQLQRNFIEGFHPSAQADDGSRARYRRYQNLRRGNSKEGRKPKEISKGKEREMKGREEEGRTISIRRKRRMENDFFFFFFSQLLFHYIILTLSDSFLSLSFFFSLALSLSS